jgi:flagellar secretion chaperone FliS
MSLASPTPPETDTLSGNDSTYTASIPAGLQASGVARPKPARQAHRQYQQAQIETASPTRLVVLLYDGAIRFCSLALEAMQVRDIETQHINLLKAQRIVAELMGSLNREVGGEVAANLMMIYTHMLEQLVQANLQDKPHMVESVLTLLRDLRETWAEVDRVTMQSAGDSPSAARPTSTLGEQSA